MPDCGRTNQPFRKGAGDWSTTIKSGSVQRGRETPTALEDIPERLRPMCQRWGYLPPPHAVADPADVEDRTEDELSDDDDDVDADAAS